MDFFAVRVKSLPKVNGVQTTPESFLHYIRTNINDFTDGSDFIPYKAGDIDENRFWLSNDPTGTLMHIVIIGGKSAVSDNGTVITSEYKPDHWIFTTLQSPMDGTHPVSGNRRFGIYKDTDGSYLIYTKGVDRITDNIVQLLQSTTKIPFSNADALWTSFQSLVSKYVNDNGGSASIMPAVTARPDWDLVKKVLNGEESIDKLKENGGCE